MLKFPYRHSFFPPQALCIFILYSMARNFVSGLLSTLKPKSLKTLKRFFSALEFIQELHSDQSRMPSLHFSYKSAPSSAIGRCFTQSGSPLKFLASTESQNSYYYTVSPNMTLNSCSYLNQIFTDFHNYFTKRLGREFATKYSLKFPPHLKGVATLPCEILIFKNCT